MIAIALALVNEDCLRVASIGCGDHNRDAIAADVPWRNRGATMMTKTQTKLAMLGLAVLTAVPTAFAQGAQPPGPPKEMA